MSLTVTWFKGLGASDAAEEATTWEALAAMCRNPKEYPTKEQLPLIKMARFGALRSDKNSLRHNANVLAASGIELDYDAEKITASAAASVLQLMGVTAAIYSSPSNTPTTPRWRVLLPLSREHAPESRRVFAKQADALLGGIVAAESFVLSQSYYFGRVAGAPYECFESVGQPIDLCGLPAVAPEPPPHPPTYTSTRNPAWRGPEDDDELIRRMYASKPSFGAALGNTASFVDLWENKVTVFNGDESRADAALALCLAWWTGDDAERIERLMRRSGLNRPKYDRDDYLPLRTIPDAIRKNEGKCYIETPKDTLPTLEAAAMTLEDNLLPFDSVENPFDILPHVVNPWLPCDEVTSLAGHGGSGKSYAALILAVHVCLGRPFAGLSTTQGKVLFFSAEDGKRVLVQRRARICRTLAIDPAQLDGKLFLLDASDLDPALYQEQRDKRQSTETPLLGALAALVQKLDIGLTIIDNASDCFSGNEIARAEVRGFIRSLRQRLARPGRAVLLLAHINKSSANGGRAAGSEDYSGSTAWHNSVRSRLSLTADGDNALKIEHMKVNHGTLARPVRLVWREGVPMVSGGFTDAGAASAKAAEKDQDTTDKAALVALIQDFDRRGERVTTSSQGSATVFKLLKGEPGFPKSTNSERLMRLLRELETEDGIYRRTVKTADRKSREVFTCAPIPNGQALQAAVGQEGTCANATE